MRGHNQDPTSHSFRSFPSELIGRRFLALAGSVLALGGTAVAFAETSTPGTLPPAVAAAECPFDLFSGPAAVCEGGQIPEACLPPPVQVELQHDQYQPQKRWAGMAIAASSRAEEINPATLIPHLEVGSEEDGGEVNNNQDHAIADFALTKAIDFQQERFIVWANKWRFKKRREALGAAVNSAEACGEDVQLTLSCDKTTWTPDKWVKHVTSIAKYFANKVQTIGVCNEPNLKGWLKAMPHKTLAQTYHFMYEKAYPILRRFNTNAKILFGELSSLQYPLVFLNKALKRLPGEKKGHPIIADGIAYHIWDWRKAARKGQVSPTSRIVSGYAIPVIEKTVDRVFTNGQIVMPHGSKQEPRLYYDEAGQMVRATGSMRDRNISQDDAAHRDTNLLDRLCGRIKAASVSFYGLIQTPKSVQANGDHWDSSMVDRKGRLDRAAYAIYAWIKAHPGCLIGNTANSNSTPLGLKTRTAPGAIPVTSP